MYTYWMATLCCVIIHPFFFFKYSCLSDSSHYLFRRASGGARLLQCLRGDFWKPSRWTLWVEMLKLTSKNIFLPHVDIFWRKHGGGKLCNDYANNWRSHSFLYFPVIFVKPYSSMHFILVSAETLLTLFWRFLNLTVLITEESHSYRHSKQCHHRSDPQTTNTAKYSVNLCGYTSESSVWS